MDPYPRTWAAIDLPALAHNIGWIKQQIGPDVQLALAAKADAYGHGLAPVCRTAVRSGADWVAVAAISEGIALRDAGIEEPILILSPILSIEAEQAVFYGLDVTVESVDLAKAISGAAESMSKIGRVHLKVDTGLHRFGCEPSHAGDIARQISSLPSVQLVGLSQHFIDSASQPEVTKAQLDAFDVAAAACEGVEIELFHAANSYGTLLYPDSRRSMVRIGIAAYGVDPADQFGGVLKPVLSMHSRVVAERLVKAGETVGYLGDWKASRDTRTLTVCAGYGDGYPRALSGRSVVNIKGRELPVVGLICMDLMMVDATDHPDAQVGDPVTLIGEGITADRLAALAGTNAHEILVRLMARVPRRWIYT